MRACLGVLLCVAGSFPAYSQTPASIEQQVESLTAMWMKAVGEKDEKTLNQIMADEFVAHVPEIGRTINRSEWLRQARMMENGECEYRTTQVRSYGEFAVASGRLVCKGDIKGIGLEEDMVVADTWVRRGDQWKVSTRVAAASPRFTGVWMPLVIGAALPSVLWLISVIRERNRRSGNLLSSVNRPSYD